MVPGLKVLFLAAEATPLAKVGGLADVAGELPAALRALGIDVLLVTPLHPSSDVTDVRIHRSVEFEIASARGVVGSEGHLGEVRGQPVLLVDGAPVRAVSGVYSNAETNGEKFGFLSRAGLEACRALGWRPDVVHANDWHTAPAVYWLSAHRPGDGFWRDAATVLTIHNLGFMGVGSESSVLGYGLMPGEDPRLPGWARSLPLPLGLLTADRITTVSPSYAQEIQTADLGYGLEGLLKARADRLEGILNGIDPTLWDPATDPSLATGFSRETLEARKANQRALRDELGLPYDPGGALCAMVTRLDTQKGVDLALEALALLEDEPWQFVLLGTGDPELEREAQAFVRVHPTRARAILRFDPALSRRVYAGADILLVPSRYEPCGLSQMIAMRYGCIPVVRATGGLRDTVRDDEAGDGNGFVFEAASPDGLAGAMRRAMRALADRSRWGALQSRAMRADHSWRRPAEKYADLYRRAARPR